MGGGRVGGYAEGGLREEMSRGEIGDMDGREGGEVEVCGLLTKFFFLVV